MQFNRLMAKFNTGMILVLCVATMASAGQRQSQQRQQQQRQRQQQEQEQEPSRAQTRGEQDMAVHTRENVIRALKREALASIKYRVFAEVAAKNGNTQLSDLFLKIAETESDEHLKTLFGFAKIVGSDIDNLKDAIGNETYEGHLMYVSYAEKAKKAGDLDVAKKFEEMAQDESKHRAIFIKVLNELRG